MREQGNGRKSRNNGVVCCVVTWKLKGLQYPVCCHFPPPLYKMKGDGRNREGTRGGRANAAKMGKKQTKIIYTYTKNY